mgnify:CR=1 FL=1
MQLTDRRGADLNEQQADDSIRILILGNSISCHPPLNGTAWQMTAGMAASSPTKDWVHLFTTMLQERAKKDVHADVLNIANVFEYNFRSFVPEKFSSEYQGSGSDIVIFQLGDNVHFTLPDDKEVFIQSYTNFVHDMRAENRLLLITSPFFPYRRQAEATQEVSLNTGAFYVDISHLGILDQRNLAAAENCWQHHEFIEQHPGDRGMREIAKAIFSVLYPAYQLKEARIQ